MEVRHDGYFNPKAPVYGYFELTNEVSGEFLNREAFLIKSISLGGANFLSNYPPLIGNSYQVLIHYGGEKHPFTVNIVHSRILRFQREGQGIFRPGVIYSTGCQILFDNDFQKNLILGIIRNDSGIPAMFDPMPAVVALAAAM